MRAIPPQSQTSHLPRAPVQCRFVAVDYDSDLLPFLLQEFPFLNISSETLHKMWRDGAQHLKFIASTDQAAQHKKNKFQRTVRSRSLPTLFHTKPYTPRRLSCMQIDDAERKYKVLTDLTKKEIEYNQRMVR